MKKERFGRKSISGQEGYGWKEKEYDYKFASVLCPLPDLLPFLVAYVERRGTVGKGSKASRTILPLLFVLSFLLLSSPFFCFLLSSLPSFPSPFIHLNAPASESLGLYGGSASLVHVKHCPADHARQWKVTGCTHYLCC